jgi:hypothetical protein
MLATAILLLCAQGLTNINLFEFDYRTAFYYALQTKGGAEFGRDSYYRTANAFNLSLIVVWLIFAYVNRIEALFDQGRGKGSESWAIKYFTKKFNPELLDEDDHQRAIKRISKLSELQHSPVERHFLTGLALTIFANAQLRSSFLWEIIWIHFAFIYGITNLALIWMTPFFAASYSGITTIGFGQLISILLLILPFLNVAEVYYG